MLLFVFSCKGKKKNFIRQIFFDFQKNILKYAETDGCGRIIFCKIGGRKKLMIPENALKGQKLSISKLLPFQGVWSSS